MMAPCNWHLGGSNRRTGRGAVGFTLVEVLVVVAVIALLAAILFPVLASARERARGATCTAHLRQIGQALSLYASDYDERFPWGIDIVDRYAPSIWGGHPGWQAFLQSMPLMHEVVDPYVKEMGVWRCPSDTGFTWLEISSTPLVCQPSAYTQYGASYAYRTELTFRGLSVSGIESPAEINVLHDLTGAWHGGSTTRAGFRYYVLFADWHVKQLSYDTLIAAWRRDMP